MKFANLLLTLFDGIGKVFAARLLKEVDSLQDIVVVYLFVVMSFVSCPEMIV